MLSVLKFRMAVLQPRREVRAGEASAPFRPWPPFFNGVFREPRLTFRLAGPEIMLVASVPLTSQAWQPFEEGDIAAISGGQLVALNRVEEVL